MSACSDAEAKVWRSEFGRSIAAQGKAVEGRARNIVQFNSPLTSEMKSIGAAFGKPGSFVRRLPVHRSATVGPMTDLNQVIIKNTLAVKESTLSNSSLQHISRSQSTITPSHVQTLTPRRIDRIRLENLLADVWSPALPYPGMTMRRSEQFKGSADQIIRKLSIASLANSFHPGKRNGSHTSMTKLQERASDPRASSRSSKQCIENKKPPRLPLAELLPADFELQRPNKRRNALRTLTMTIERPFSPLMSQRSEKEAIRRAQSVMERRPADGHAEPGPILSGVALSKSSSDHRNLEPAITDADCPGRPSDKRIAMPEPCATESKKVKTGRLRRLFG